MKHFSIFLLFVAIGFSLFLHSTCRKGHIRRWKVVASQTFTEALQGYLQQNSASLPVYRQNNCYSFKDSVSHSVSITSKDGKQEISTDSFKSVRNIMTDPVQRAVTSVMLTKTPLHPDTLNAAWQQLLSVQGYSDAQTKIRILSRNLKDQVSEKYSTLLPLSLQVDSLTTWYLGYANETEVTAFIGRPLRGNMAVVDYILSFLPLLIAGILVGSMHALRSRFHLSFSKKAQHVDASISMVEMVSIQLYQLGDVCFNTHTLLLQEGTQEERLLPQQGLLLTKFIEAPEHRLTTAEIMTALWPDNSGTPQRVQKAVARLRLSLLKFSGITVIFQKGGYLLKTPISSRKTAN